MALGSLSRWPWWRRWFGDRSERAASRFLRRLGYRILLCNYSCPRGEIDIVALDGRCLVFVEVRSTTTADVEGRMLSIDIKKQRRMSAAATHFLTRHSLRDALCRFDIIIMSWPPNVRNPQISHLQSAFESLSD